MLTIYKNEDNIVKLAGLKDTVTLAYVNDATVTYEFKSATAATLTSGTLSYVAASDGIYRGTVDASVDFKVGSKYYLEVTGASSGRDLFRRIECEVKYRGSS